MHRSMRSLRILILAAATGLAASSCQPVRTGGCLKDTDCKGRRICNRGTCAQPGQACRCDCPTVVPRPRARPRVRPRPKLLQLTLGAPLTAVSMFRMDTLRRGRSAHAGPPLRPRRLWRKKLGRTVNASPTIGTDGTIYVGSHDGHVYAYTSAGRRRWRFRTGDKIWSSAALSPKGKTLYVGSDDDHLYALDTRTGKQRWKLRLGACHKLKTKTAGALCDVDSSPAVAPDGTIYVGGAGLFAVTPKGTLKFHFKTDRRVASSPAVLPDGTAIFGSQDNHVYAVDRHGKKKWSYRTKGDVDSSPAIGPDGTVYIGTDDGRLLALWPGGTFRWSVLTGGPIRSSPALATDGTVYVGSYDGRLYAVSKEGRVQWVLATGARIHASPVVDSQGRIFAASQDHRLYAVDKTGTLRWQHRFPNDVDSTPALSATGRLYIGCDDGYLYALQ